MLEVIVLFGLFILRSNTYKLLCFICFLTYDNKLLIFYNRPFTSVFIKVTVFAYVFWVLSSVHKPWNIE